MWSSDPIGALGFAACLAAYCIGTQLSPCVPLFFKLKSVSRKVSSYGPGLLFAFWSPKASIYFPVSMHHPQQFRARGLQAVVSKSCLQLVIYSSSCLGTSVSVRCLGSSLDYAEHQVWRGTLSPVQFWMLYFHECSMSQCLTCPGAQPLGMPSLSAIEA